MTCVKTYHEFLELPDKWASFVKILIRCVTDNTLTIINSQKETKSFALPKSSNSVYDANLKLNIELIYKQYGQIIDFIENKN